MLRSVTVSAPAKLVLTGEHAVLEPDRLAVVAAVARETEARIAPSPAMRLTAPALDLADAPARYADGRWSLDTPHAQAGFVSEALSVSLRYLEEGGAEIAPFHLELSPALTENGLKVGLGGSAATSVAIVAAVLAAFGTEPEAGLVYRLAAIAHLNAQGSGSGIDVAASAFGGVLAFSSHHPAWLRKRLAEAPSLREVVAGPWPHLRIKPLPWPVGWKLMVGWTGKSASTPEILRRIAALKATGDPRYEAYLAAMRESSRHLIDALRQADKALALQALQEGRDAMQRLGEALDEPLETPMLARLADEAVRAGTAGKPSGAGGGDCGIALTFDDAQASRLRDAWAQTGVRPLDLAIASHGVRLS